MDMIDLLLAILHHLLAFALVAALAAEAGLIRSELAGRAIGRLAGIDRTYGMIAMLVLFIGVGRVLFGLKGWEFYVHSWAFWAKMACFAGVALLSIVPTRRILAWNRQAAGDPSFAVDPAEVAAIRAWVRAEIVLFALVPIFAATMARGY